MMQHCSRCRCCVCHLFCSARSLASDSRVTTASIARQGSLENFVPEQDVRKADKAAQDVSKTNITEQSIELKDMKLSDAAEAKDEVVKAAAGAADTLQQVSNVGI